MLGGLGLALVGRSLAEGSFLWSFCEPVEGEARGPVYFWLYVYYLSKFYELLDTLLQLLRGSRPPFYVLHVYHHTCVIFMAWGWLEYRQTLAVYGAMFNCFVHVIMYTYFFQRVVTGKTPWWKSYVTRVQIVQFVSSGTFGT